MLVTFCLRLAGGLVAVLPLLPTAEVPPRFFRVQYLTALGLLAVAGFFHADVGELPAWIALGLGMVVCFAGSVIWHVEGAPGRNVVLALAIMTLVALNVVGTLRVPSAVSWGRFSIGQERPVGNRPHGLADGMRSVPATVDSLLSAVLLGAAMSAMLMGHSYLIGPAMSSSPLNRLLAALSTALTARMVLAGLAIYWWTGARQTGNLETETTLWLGARWLVGLVIPLVLTWLAWETARIRSTQSATGILYVVVTLVFLGELTAQLLVQKTGAAL